MNLLDETEKILKENNKDWEDVEWIGNKEGDTIVSVDEFVKLADKEYDNDFGEPEVLQSLVVVGDNWWLERWDYDGSEGWTFKTKPVKKGKLNIFYKGE